MKNMINAITTVQPTNLEIPLWRRMTLVGHDLDLGSTSSPTTQSPLPVSAPGHSHNGGGHPASCRWPQPRRRRRFLWRRTSGWSASSASYRHRRRAEPAAQEHVLRPGQCSKNLHSMADEAPLFPAGRRPRFYNRLSLPAPEKVLAASHNRGGTRHVAPY